MATDAPAGRAAPREPTRRLFYALWPDEPMQAAMVQATREAAGASGGRPVPAGNLHVTLAFLGSVPERRLQELAEVAREAAGILRSEPDAAASPGKPVELVFNHLEHWRAAQVLCASPAEPPATVVRLARKLRELLVGRGFAHDLESPRSVAVETARQFRPHVTLARRVHRPPRSIEWKPVTWSFADFALVDSKTLPEGSVYAVLERFPLSH